MSEEPLSPVSDVAPTAGVKSPAVIKLTPMVQQYLRVKERYPDAILLYRLGDFYEMFFEDAERASRLLDLTLTARNKGDEARIPLCGVPHHSVQPYIQKLLEHGLKVAICEQVEDPASAKGIVERKVVRVITPGTVLDEEILDPRAPSYLAVVTAKQERAALAVVDLSTGELRAAEIESLEALHEEVARLRPREVVVASGAGRPALPAALRTSELAEAAFSQERFFAWLENRGGGDIAAWRARPLASAAIGALLAVLEEQLVGLDHLRAPELYRIEEFLVVDEASRRNLELVETTRGERVGSLLWVLDRTATPMGARVLRRWLLYPLLDPARIGERLDAVEELAADSALRDDVTAALDGLGDLERLGGRIGSGTASPRDLVRLRQALLRAETVKARLGSVRSGLLGELREQTSTLPALRDLVACALVDVPPLSAKQGDLIRAGYSAQVDELRGLRHDGKSWIAALESRERSRTGIGSLKVRYNKVFGYYLEVTNPNLKLVPTDYQRKQTIAGGERFVTPELKEYESKVLGAEERLHALEADLFANLLERAASHLGELAATAHALARLDVLRSLATIAVDGRYVRPMLDRSVALEIREGRHAVVERTLPPGRFVPNDTDLDPERAQVVVLTGPNMAGKSTYLRQNALIVLMAQMGGFVPAAQARIGVVDRIFTRVGAADDLAAGDSTFMVEMKETAHILSHLTPRSLVVLDEIGRGTSTFDGISIAWAVAEHLHAVPERPKTLFATHFHELTELVLTAERVVNCSVAVKEWQGDVVFLRRIVPGPASQSYGIHVARLAGVPESVVVRAREVLHNLESGERNEAGEPRLAVRGSGSRQLGLFAEPSREAAAVLESLRAVDPLTLTPIEALSRLADFVERARRAAGKNS
ncbi:MAG TPA: DNA mismatch repair protein MutS [Candidatus Binatia bacterium]|nr:DNA mismatch repair protein MutS [Candidatus Binatia bacterium]